MNGDQTTILYRPAGQEELDLVKKSGFKAFPPAVEAQPVLNFLESEEYATFIARQVDANKSSSGYIGYVLSVSVHTDFITQFAIRKEGSAIALEYEIPADRIIQFNENIVGMIELIAQYTNNSY
jgi:hypothetical protein